VGFVALGAAACAVGCFAGYLAQLVVAQFVPLMIARCRGRRLPAVQGFTGIALLLVSHCRRCSSSRTSPRCA
jgi:hypothetical protein